MVSDVLAALLSASYRFLAYVVFGSQQSENTVLPFGDVNPAGHETHEDAALSEYVFTGHVTHAAGPDAFLNFPATHATHGPTSGPEYPGLHEHAVTFILPADEFAFTGQLVHAALPEEFLYVPEGHTVHCPLEAPVSGPVYPVLHEHSSADEQLCATPPHGILVRSTPWIMALEMAVVEAVLRNSSTTNAPAMSAFK